MTHKGPPPFVDGDDQPARVRAHRIAPKSDDLVDVYCLSELVEGREGAKKDQKGQTTADNKLEIT